MNSRPLRGYSPLFLRLERHGTFDFAQDGLRRALPKNRLFNPVFLKPVSETRNDNPED